MKELDLDLYPIVHQYGVTLNNKIMKNRDKIFWGLVIIWLVITLGKTIQNHSKFKKVFHIFVFWDFRCIFIFENKESRYTFNQDITITYIH